MNLLKSERERLGLNQREVFEKIGVSKGTYIRWEGGYPIPSDKLKSMAELGFDVQYIITGERSQPSLAVHKGTPLDHALLVDAIDSVMTIYERIKRRPKNRQQLAELIATVYELYVEYGKSESQQETIIRLIKAAS